MQIARHRFGLAKAGSDSPTYLLFFDRWNGLSWLELYDVWNGQLGGEQKADGFGVEGGWIRM